MARTAVPYLNRVPAAAARTAAAGLQPHSVFRPLNYHAHAIVIGVLLAIDITFFKPISKHDVNLLFVRY